MTDAGMTDAFSLTPIATVRGGRRDPVDDHWEGVEATIELDPSLPADSLLGLDGFSHLDVVYVFDRVDTASIVTGARHPRGNTAWPRVGIFAQRAKARPNRLGVSTCRIVSVGHRTIRVAGLDAVDGTRVLDIKPHMVEMGPRSEVREPEWARELMEHYWR